MPHVLVADHEPEVAELARRYLGRAGLRVLVTGSPADTVRVLAGQPAGAPGAPDVFVIDLTMPGLEVRAIRQALAPGVPVVFLQRRGESRPHGLNSPPVARRWLTRPFSPRTLVVAVAELLHPMPGQRRPAGSGGGDRGRHEMVVNGRGVSLTRTEFALVTALAGHPGRVLSRQRLLAALESERGKRPSPRAVDVYIAQLRAKLGDGSIRTVHGVGYVLDLDAGAT
ncbi:MAG TPA: response regulator transcription factor [Trebonia sp.]|nr:response regulator transcription factor [Trebonia sp.]